ncbi:SWIM zinc finger family protein [Aliikangiella marina]|uniref:SWIM zinc finger family protein n=1 Tax=Aliikangiella marina TaxID=1712262 RepID=A0A545TGS4_9GAMM|nr:SWIM zinc finger family protein [Aliikangiella marina]TQV76427.1 SWIM zinc finger family protein [Aliikangiella marina]
MSTAIDYTYEYAFPSAIHTKNATQQFALATSSPNQVNPYFFEGRVRSPKIFGDMLLTLSEVVRTHFFLPRPALLDPVLTSSENLLRLEGFSGCCGVYARVDLPSNFFDGECLGRGTTNVDFNTPMRNALMRLRDSENVQFAVGKEEVALTKSEESIIEKKVKLPLRWIKGFSEVQAYQPRLMPKMEVTALEGLKFIRSLPKTAVPKQPSYAISRGRSVRFSQRPQTDAVKITGTHRVRIIEPLLLRAKSLRIWTDETNETSAWEVRFPVGSFFLMISPEVYRGFSGEGQVLSELAQPPSEQVIAQVRAQLKWQAQIQTADIANQLNLSVPEINKALSVLGSRGLAGFDVVNGYYFHRELPFELERVEEMQPRLKNARKLVEAGGITVLSSSCAEFREYEVPGKEVLHRVKLTESKDTCTCVWFSKHQGSRGPCKHILAAQITEDSRDLS